MNKCLLNKYICLVMAMAPIVSHATDAAAAETVSPGARRPNCGDFSILGPHPVRPLLEKHCGTIDEADQKAFLSALARLDPVAQARAAAQRADFRLAAVVGGGPLPPGPRRFWSVYGGQCETIEDRDVAIWFHGTDAFYSATHSQLNHGMVDFAEQYNATLMREPGFPAARGCHAG